MRKLMRKVAILAALGIAAPVWAQSAAADGKDTATEKKTETTKKTTKKKKGAAGEMKKKTTKKTTTEMKKDGSGMGDQGSTTK